MAGKLIPGNISPKNEAWTVDPLFANSMASAIEDQLDALMQADGLPGLDMDASEQSVRDRRRLFVAIARGVVAHLEANRSAIKTFCEDNQTKPVSVVEVDYR